MFGTLRAGSFVAQWIEDAGGTYALETVDDQSNVALSLESMLELVSKTDAWVLVTYDKDGVNEGDVLAMDPRHAEVMKAVDEVWVCNTAEVDYFGEVVAHPEWVLEDLAALVQSNSEGPHGVFENLSDLPRGHEDPPCVSVDVVGPRLCMWPWARWTLHGESFWSRC